MYYFERLYHFLNFKTDHTQNSCVRPCRLCFHSEEPRVPEELCKSRKSRDGERLENAFSSRKGERTKERGGRKKRRTPREDRIDRTTGGKGLTLARVLPWKSSNFSGDIHGSPLSCSRSFNPEKTVRYLTTSKGESVVATGSRQKNNGSKGKTLTQGRPSQDVTSVSADRYVILSRVGEKVI